MGAIAGWNVNDALNIKLMIVAMILILIVMMMLIFSNPVEYNDDGRGESVDLSTDLLTVVTVNLLTVKIKVMTV